MCWSIYDEKLAALCGKNLDPRGTCLQGQLLVNHHHPLWCNHFVTERRLLDTFHRRLRHLSPTLWSDRDQATQRCETWVLACAGLGISQSWSSTGFGDSFHPVRASQMDDQTVSEDRLQTLASEDRPVGDRLQCLWKRLFHRLP